MSNPEGQKSLTIKPAFDEAREGEKGWKIRYGAEPIDLHLTGKGTHSDKFIENKLGITAGPGGIFNHNYIEILNPDSEVVKRVHGLGLEPKDGQLEMTGKGRLIGLVVDGKYTPFSDDPIQRDDPHPHLPNNLQHAESSNRFGENPTKIVFNGTERQVMEIYGAMLNSSIDINNQGIKFDLLRLNSNTFNAEMKEKVTQISGILGVKVKSHDPSGWDIGSDPEKIQTAPATRVKAWDSMLELRNHIDTLEKAAHEQWETLKHESLQNGQDINLIKLNTTIPNSR